MAAEWFPVGWAHYLGGGVVIGLGVSLAFLAAGLVTGMSTVFSSTWSWVSRLDYFQRDRLVASRSWRVALAVGLVLGAALHTAVGGGGTVGSTGVTSWQLVAGGVLIGFGARMSDGCTSGHGICGLASFRLPSLLAVLTFLATAMISARLVLALGGA